MLYTTASEFLTSCYNVLMPHVERALQAKDAMQYDIIYYLRIMRYVSAHLTPHTHTRNGACHL